MMDTLLSLLPVYAAYVLATASPGPSNMAIMATAMQHGRRSALALAAGVVTGSMSWAALAATGVSALLAAYAHALYAIKILGGIYLLYLASKAAKSAFEPRDFALATSDTVPNAGSLYRRGLLLHITNPKAVLAWIAIISLGLRPNAAPHAMAWVLLGCATLSVLVFGTYALAFSTAVMVRGYRRARRWIDAALAGFFALAGVRLLMSKF
ncbi:MAG: LysE family translocator [Burkholderiaceae bacterium]|nr:LysE family translocator [Burkholderiaceae bacterium]